MREETKSNEKRKKEPRPATAQVDAFRLKVRLTCSSTGIAQTWHIKPTQYPTHQPATVKSGPTM